MLTTGVDSAKKWCLQGVGPLPTGLPPLVVMEYFGLEIAWFSFITTWLNICILICQIMYILYNQVWKVSHSSLLYGRSSEKINSCKIYFVTFTLFTQSRGSITKVEIQSMRTCFLSKVSHFQIQFKDDVAEKMDFNIFGITISNLWYPIDKFTFQAWWNKLEYFELYICF